MKLKISICSKQAQELAALLEPSNFIEVAQYTNDPLDLRTEAVEVLLADPNLAVKVLDKCTRLNWMQSTWAGNAPLVAHKKRDYQLTVAKGIFDAQIREYVFTYLLSHVRKTLEMEKIRSPQHWQTVKPSYLAGKTLGIMGTGSLAQALLPLATLFEMHVIGVSRSGKHIDGFQQVYCFAQRFELAKQADFVVNLLPDTLATRHCFNSAFFNAMKPYSVLINAGRGSAIDERALLQALAKHQPTKAILDVFDIEPLPEQHPYWQHPQIHITHHTAAESAPQDVVTLFSDNAKRFYHNQPLHGMLNWEVGY